MPFSSIMVFTQRNPKSDRSINQQLNSLFFQACYNKYKILSFANSVCMIMPLLNTKTRIPAVQTGLLQRPSLLNKLYSVSQTKLTLISAPAGFGKTALLSQWVKQNNLPVAWVSLDENDNDPTLFWGYFIIALQNLKSSIGKTAFSCLQSPQPLPVESVLSSVINDITDNLTPFIFVLDDYHVITGKPVHEALLFLVDHLPEQMHLVIASRADPPLPLARFRVRNQLNEIRAADLRFSTAETSILLNEMMKLDLTAKDISALTARTEGWIASLQMAAISLKNRQDKSEFIARFSGSHRYILDYLTGEVLQHLDKDTLDFLLKTSILGRLSAPLCDAVVGTDNSQQMLEHLEEANLFIEPLDEMRQWYRYHQLFADLLHAQLQKIHPQLESQLHLNGSMWFEEAGYLEEAVHHALAGKDFERAAGLVEKLAEGLLAQSRIATLLRLINALSPETVDERPWLRTCYAWALLLSGQSVQVLKVLIAEDEIGFSEADEYQAKVRGHTMTIRGYLSRAQGDIKHALQFAKEAVELLPTKDLTARSANALNLGIITYMTGEVNQAAQYFRECSETALAGNNFYVAVESLCSLGDVQVEQGQLHQALETYQQAIDLGTKLGYGQPLPAAGHAYHGLGRLYYEWNNPEASLQHVLSGIKLNESAHLPVSYYYTTLSKIQLAQGKQDEASESLKKVDVAAFAGTLDEIHLSSWKAGLLLIQGDKAALERWARAVETSMEINKVPDYSLELPYLTLLRIKIALGEIGQIPELLGILSQKAEKQARGRSVIEIGIVRALALMQSGEINAAVQELEKILLLAEPERFIRIFIDQGPILQQLLRQTLRISQEKDYIHSLLEVFPKTGNQTAQISQTETAFTEYLNDREITILRFLAAGLSNNEIAGKLFLSLNTIKWYIRNLYGKLGVNSRVEAVNQARKLNLL